MGKRSDYERKKNDFYVTQISSLKSLVPHIPSGATYIEPCYGTGAIERGLNKLCDAVCVARFDMYPDDYENDITPTWADATVATYGNDADFFITNPPWDRSKKSGYMLHRIIENLASQKPTWLLFDADWMHTKQAAPYLEYCIKIVSVGRASWMDNGQTGKDNCCFYLFDKSFMHEATELVGRI